MDFKELEQFSDKDMEMFRQVCNQLLGQTFIIRSLYKKDAPQANNPAYLFLARHYETVKAYLSLIDWELHKEETAGYFFVVNTQDANRCTFDKQTTIILLTLRILFDEAYEKATMFQDVLCHVSDLLEKLINVFGYYRKKPNMNDFARSMRELERFQLIRRIDGAYSQTDCAFTILPTVQTAVSAERTAALVKELKQSMEETDDEEAEESPAD